MSCTMFPPQWDFIRAEACRGSHESWASCYTALAFIECSQKERWTFGPIQQKNNNHSVASELSTQTHTHRLYFSTSSPLVRVWETHKGAGGGV